MNVSFASPPSFAQRGARRGRKRLGVLYEKDVHAHFMLRYGAQWRIGPWIKKLTETGQKEYRQPDALLVDPGQSKITIVEVKHSHTMEAWRQLRLRYQPLVEELFPGYGIACCEVVKFHDPFIKFPEPTALVKGLDDCEVGKMHVLVFNPQLEA